MNDDLLYVMVFGLLAAMVLVPSILATRPELVTRMNRHRRRSHPRGY